MRTIGLIGGTSWHSTIVYYRLINEMVGRKIGPESNPPLILYSLNIQLMREQNREKILHAYLHIARKLEIAGAQALVICANTPHMVYDFVQPKISIPILHIADAIGKEAREKDLQTLGLLGTKPTMQGDFLEKRLRSQFGINTIVPEEENWDDIHNFISKELTQGKFTETARSFFIDQMQLLKEKGAEGIILGCTELPMLLGQEDFDLPLMNTTHLHAQLATNFILQTVEV
ncbi:aspartate/glutamate racemase family protein [Salinimicrobium soli]|uniref:aspartate/glutamate racemase family protein n=1 Tax=Salinimicrobium soli TaxID=1254399 RepID=UPI003AAFD0B8